VLTEHRSASIARERVSARGVLTAAIVAIASVTLPVPVAASAPPIEVLSFTSTAAAGSTLGDENPFIVDAEADAPQPPFGSAFSANERVELVFRVDQPLDLVLSGDFFYESFWYGGAQVDIAFTDVTVPGSPIALASWSGLSAPGTPDACVYDPPCLFTVGESLELEPGDYALLVEVAANGMSDLFLGRLIQGSGYASVGLWMERFEAPEPSTPAALSAGTAMLVCLARRRARG